MFLLILFMFNYITISCLYLFPTPNSRSVFLCWGVIKHSFIHSRQYVDNKIHIKRRRKQSKCVSIHYQRLLTVLLGLGPDYAELISPLSCSFQTFMIFLFWYVFQDHQNNPTSGAMQCIVGILSCLVSHKETNMQDLYDQGNRTHLRREREKCFI